MSKMDDSIPLLNFSTFQTNFSLVEEGGVAGTVATLRREVGAGVEGWEEEDEEEEEKEEEEEEEEDEEEKGGGDMGGNCRQERGMTNTVCGNGTAAQRRQDLWRKQVGVCVCSHKKYMER